MGFWTGEEGKYKQINQLDKRQQQIQRQAENAGSGAFRGARNYYNDLLNGNENYNALSAPQMRQFNEQIVPDLSEQFAGMGSGALSSSGFRNAAIGAGTDLSERLGAIRANLRQQGAQGLQSLGQQALNPHYENVYEAPQPGFLQTAAGLLGNAAGAAAGAYFGPGGGFGAGGGNQLAGAQARPGGQSPYQS